MPPAPSKTPSPAALAPAMAAAAGSPLLLPFRDFRPRPPEALACGREAAVIGRTALGAGCWLGDFAVLRGDGDSIEVGASCWLGARATVHIADETQGAKIGGGVTVGRYALVHACTLGDGVVVGDAAVVMDGSVVGEDAAVAAGSLVPPGKTHEGGWLHAGSPARPVRPLEPGEIAALRLELRDGAPSPVTAPADDPLPLLDQAPYRTGPGGPLHASGGREPSVGAGAYVAPTAAVAGDVRLGEGSSVWFSAAVHARASRIEVGARTNVQDNSILDAGDSGLPLVLGDDVTVGHNVRLGACRVGDRCLVGMGATVMDGAVVEDGAFVGARALVEPGAVVEAGWIWAGRPAAPFREVRPDEADYFRMGKEVYERYARDYLAGG